MTAINSIINNVDTIILNYVQGAFGTLSPVIATLWTSMFIIFIAVYGYKVIISGKFGMQDLLVHCFRIIVVLVIATGWDEFFLFVYDLTTTFPSDIAGQILAGTVTTLDGTPTPSDVASANTALGSFYERGSQASSNILDAAGWSDFGLFMYAFAVWGATIALAGYAMMLIILSKLAMGILLAVGPFFILMLVFGQTKTLFEGWLRTLLNYALIPVFVYSLLALLLALLEDPTQTLLDKADDYDLLASSIGSFLLMSVISVLLLSQIMNFAAELQADYHSAQWDHLKIRLVIVQYEA